MTTPAATIALLSPQDAYTLGMLDERLRQAERLREEVLERLAAAPKPKSKPKATESKAKEPELPHANGDATAATPPEYPYPPPPE